MNKTVLFNTVIGSALAFLATSSAASAQGLNWEGQTGAFITPFAYTSAGPADGSGVGKPQVSAHYMRAGSVVGDQFQVAATVGIGKKAEIGYSRAFTSEGDTALSPAFGKGFNIFHGKLKVLEENRNGSKTPAVAVGFVLRSNVKRGGNFVANDTTTSGDVYVVATKTFTNGKTPFLLSGGLKGSNSALFGLAGKANEFSVRPFGTAAVVVNGPSKSTLIFGVEAAMQPKGIEGIPGAKLPTTADAFVRILPKPGLPLNVDFGLARVGGNIGGGIDIKAKSVFAMGISYQFK